ncbi:MAG: hypothetical protein U9N59_05695, partial [Campylobacterota bacterium]|nr:hypothetical protein [Campylobacterota bacterium]
MKKYYYIFKMFELHKCIDRYNYFINKKEEESFKIAKRREGRVKQDLYKNQLQSKEVLASIGIDEETLKEHNDIQTHKKIEEIEYSKKLEEKNLTDYEYKFNIFYERLLEHIIETMEFYAPISIEEFKEYYALINDMDLMEEYFEDLDTQSAHLNVLDCKDILKYINEFEYFDIIERINKDIAKNEELEKQKELQKTQSINKYNIDEDIEELF